MQETLHIRSESSLEADVFRRLVLGSEPWRTLGLSEADLPAMLEAARKDELLVARVDGEVAGFAIYQMGFLMGAYVRLLVVDADFRGQGLGKKILSAIEDVVFTTYPNLYLCVSDFNAGARSFYEKCGFAVVGELPGLLLSGHSEILLRKSVGSWRENWRT